MKIKSFLPSKIIACMECFGLYVTLVYLFVELKPEKHEAVIYLCFLYGVICLGLTVIFYNLRRVYFYREKCVLHFGKYSKTISWDEFEVKRIVQFKKDTWHEICFSLYPGIDEHNMDYFHPFTIVIITLEDGYYWADGLFMKREDIVPVMEDYGIQFTERK